MSVELVIFLACAVIVISGAFGVILSRNPVHSALSLVATLFGMAVLFLNQNAQFLAAVQVIVYTGAIVVLILFVLMLLGVDREEDVETEPLVGQRALAGVGAGAVFLLLFALFMIGGDQVVTGEANCVTAPAGDVTPYEPQCVPVDARSAWVGDEANVNQVGGQLFTTWVFAFEVTAALLTIAVVAAVVLSRRARNPEPLPEPEPIATSADELGESEEVSG
jgi:NADH-quinone oxidoreductase subunit J